MLIKAADDHTRDRTILEDLRRRSDIAARTRTDIDREIRSLLAGLAGERDAAYEIELTFGRTSNFMTIGMGLFRRAWTGVRRNVGQIGFGQVAGPLAGALGCVDIVLGSLPPIPGKEQIQEFKGCVEKGAEMVSLAFEGEA